MSREKIVSQEVLSAFVPADAGGRKTPHRAGAPPITAVLNKFSKYPTSPYSLVVGIYFLRVRRNCWYTDRYLIEIVCTLPCRKRVPGQG